MLQDSWLDGIKNYFSNEMNLRIFQNKPTRWIFQRKELYNPSIYSFIVCIYGNLLLMCLFIIFVYVFFIKYRRLEVKTSYLYFLWFGDKRFYLPVLETASIVTLYSNPLLNRHTPETFYHLIFQKCKAKPHILKYKVCGWKYLFLRYEVLTSRQRYILIQLHEVEWKSGQLLTKLRLAIGIFCNLYYNKGILIIIIILIIFLFCIDTEDKLGE